MNQIEVPELALVVLVGVTGAGKSTFAARHFTGTEVLSSDAARAMVADDAEDQSATPDAFAVLCDIATRRLRRGLLTVVDATSLRTEDRRVLLDVAKECDVFAVAIVLDVPRSELTRRAEVRGRDVAVVNRQHTLLRKSRKSLRKEGFRFVHLLDGVAEVDTATLTRTRLFNNRTDLCGPFDIIGDIHGCATELIALLRTLGWPITEGEPGTVPQVGDHPGRRQLIFVGDLVDRGPDTPTVLAVVMGLVARGVALCVRGNHEEKLLRVLRSSETGVSPDGRRSRRSETVQLNHGLAESIAQLSACSPEFRSEVIGFLDSLVSHYVLDGGRLVVAHAGLAQRYHGRTSGRVREIAMYGETTGERDRWGFPVRIDWARDYRGSAQVVYGHTPVPAAAWINNTLCLDTGCVFGGNLSALRYPEREITSVPAERVHYDPGRPLGYGTSAADERIRTRLRLDDVLGKRSIVTTAGPAVSIRADNAAAALETMSRFAIDPRWLRYLPATMSPVGSDDPALLESPGAAFDFYAAMGITELTCEEKHMGSRAVLVLVRDTEAAHRDFGIADGAGAIYTRTGRSFFTAEDTARILRRASAAAEALCAELDCSWVILDAEILPWNIKGENLIREQFAEVAAAERAHDRVLATELAAAAERGLDVAEMRSELTRAQADGAAFTAAYARYVDADAGVDDIRVAAFEVLAAGGGSGGAHTFTTRSRSWHLRCGDALAAADPTLFAPTRRISVDVNDSGARADGERWWTELTAAGGEGMVVKPAANTARDQQGRLAPAGVKVRGSEYLRIIYGPSYQADLDRLRGRDLGHKRSMAIREYRLGREALERHVAGAPLWQIHECVFGVLALESEPVDSRL